LFYEKKKENINTRALKVVPIKKYVRTEIFIFFMASLCYHSAWLIVHYSIKIYDSIIVAELALILQQSDIKSIFVNL
jgi:hypothetical protein